jgi:hypothetical protein
VAVAGVGLGAVSSGVAGEPRRLHRLGSLSGWGGLSVSEDWFPDPPHLVVLLLEPWGRFGRGFGGIALERGRCSKGVWSAAWLCFCLLLLLLFLISDGTMESASCMLLCVFCWSNANCAYNVMKLIVITNSKNSTLLRGEQQFLQRGIMKNYLDWCGSMMFWVEQFALIAESFSYGTCSGKPYVGFCM